MLTSPLILFCLFSAETFSVDIFLEGLDNPDALPYDPVMVDDNSDITKQAIYGSGINVLVLDRRTVQLVETLACHLFCFKGDPGRGVPFGCSDTVLI